MKSLKLEEGILTITFKHIPSRITTPKGKLYVCPKAKECVEDCDCKEPHELKDCMRGDPLDPDLSEDCFVKCVPVKSRKGG